MKIKIINPNTTQSMTESIENLARRVARSDTQVWAVTRHPGRTASNVMWMSIWLFRGPERSDPGRPRGRRRCIYHRLLW